MAIKLFERFDYKKLFKFTLPSIIMMIFTSIYGVVDGLFVSNIVGDTAFAALNFIMPYLMILGTAGFMLGTGGSALISKTLGEGDNEKANKIFSMVVYVSVVLGAVLAIIGFFTVRGVASLMGATGQMLDDCTLYGRIICIALPAFLLQLEFQSIFVTAEKPQLGLYMSIIAGVANMVLDALFMAVLGWGLAGAAIATATSQAIGGIVPLVYFFRKNSSILRVGSPYMDPRALGKICTNGSSELMSNISMSLVGMLYNIQLMSYAGENGVSAYGVMMYVNFVFISIFIGYSVGVAPVIGYHFGAQNHDELRSLRKKSTVIILGFSACMLVLGQALAPAFAKIFVGYSPELYELTLRGFRFFCFSFLFAGMAIFGSSFFTALNDGLTSAIISF
ncbi:MAG: MATE family efflux transporter, partial [Clostridia bacterium]|nr:MATE family efflux transporter [Clostridia bacterium]